MNERGFFTVIGLCLLLAAAISIKGVQEFEANYSRGASISQMEHELQNFAESEIVRAYEKNKYGTFERPSERLGIVTIEVFEKPATLKMKNGDNVNEVFKNPEKPVKVLIAVASCDAKFIKGKIYRRALAYIPKDEPNAIYFVNSS